MRKGEIGRRIRTVRRERGLTLRQVAATAGLSATHISEIERGHTTPTVGASAPGDYLRAWRYDRHI